MDQNEPQLNVEALNISDSRRVKKIIPDRAHRGHDEDLTRVTGIIKSAKGGLKTLA
jgi:hypothetical protein